MPLKNFYTANSVQPGDVFVCTIKCMVTHTGYRLYRCPYEGYGEPDGDRNAVGKLFYDGKNDEPLTDEQITAEMLFPILRQTDQKPDDL